MGFDSNSHSHAPRAPVAAQPTASANQPNAPQRPPRNIRDTDFVTDDIDYEKKMAQKEYMENLRSERLRQNPFADDDDELEPRSEMPPWFVVFYKQYVRQRIELVNMIKAANNQPSSYDEAQLKRNTIDGDNSAAPLVDSPYIDVETGQPVDPLVYKKLSMNITLLEGGILFHSVFVGMTISITIDGFIILLVAILFHQMFEGLGLGSRIAAVPYKRGSLRPWVLVVAFGTTAPIGQAIGLLARNSYDPNSAFGLIIVGVFNAM